MKITEAQLRTWLLQDRVDGDVLNCSTLGGFHARVNRDSPKGDIASASFRVKFRVNGTTQQTLTIAKYGEITLAEARKRAGQEKAEGKAGIDKIQQRRDNKAQKAEEQLQASTQLPTIQRWYDNTHKDRLTERGKSGQQRVTYLERIWLPAIGNFTRDQLSPDDIVTPLSTIGTKVKESTARKYLDYLKEAISSYAEYNRTTNPIAGTKWGMYVRLAGLSWDIDDDDEESPRTPYSPAEFAKVVSAIEQLEPVNKTV